MAHSVKEQRVGPAVELREELNDAERLVAQVNSSNVVHFLTLLDTITARLERLADSGLDLRGEHSRMETIERRLYKQPRDVVKAVRPLGGMKKLRQEHADDEHFWWFLDDLAVQQRNRTVRRALTTLGSIVLVLGLLYGGMRVFFPPDPDVVLVSGVTGDLPELASRGQYEEGLRRISETEAQLTRSDTELLIWRGVLEDALGNQAAAEAALAEARSMIESGDLSDFWMLLGNAQLVSGSPDKAEVSAQEVLALNPDSARAHFLLGGIAEARGNRDEAIAYYEEVFELAIDQDPQLAVVSRVRIGNLIQQLEGPPPLPQQTPTAP